MEAGSRSPPPPAGLTDEFHSSTFVRTYVRTYHQNKKALMMMMASVASSSLYISTMMRNHHSASPLRSTLNTVLFGDPSFACYSSAGNKLINLLLTPSNRLDHPKASCSNGLAIRQPKKRKGRMLDGRRGCCRLPHRCPPMSKLATRSTASLHRKANELCLKKKHIVES